MAQAPPLSDPQAQKDYLREFAAALSAQAATATDALEASDGLLLEATSPAVRIEARFADGRLMISFTDLENLPAFAAQVRALKASYCADMTRDFIPVVEPMSRRLRFQRTLPLETGAEVPAPQILAQALTASLGAWYATDQAQDKAQADPQATGAQEATEEQVLRL